MAETRARNGTQIPDPTLLRMCRYLRILERTDDEKISSAEIAEAAGVNAAQVRKDLSFFGEFGQPGVGYRTKDLLDSLKRGRPRLGAYQLPGLREPRLPHRRGLR